MLRRPERRSREPLLLGLALLLLSAAVVLLIVWQGGRARLSQRGASQLASQVRRGEACPACQTVDTGRFSRCSQPWTAQRSPAGTAPGRRAVACVLGHPRHAAAAAADALASAAHCRRPKHSLTSCSLPPSPASAGQRAVQQGVAGAERRRGRRGCGAASG